MSAPGKLLAISVSFFLFLFILLPKTYAQETCKLNETEGTIRYLCDGIISGGACERDDQSITPSQDSACQIVNSINCSDNRYFTDTDSSCVHKTGGVYEPSHPLADPQGCVYNFQRVEDKSFCENPSSTGTSGNDTDQAKNPIPTNKNWEANKQTTFQFNNIVGGLSCLFTNIPFGSDGCPTTIFTKDGPKTRILYGAEGGGALGASTHFIAQMYNNPPASGVQYVASIIRGGFNIAPPAYAQVGGSGAAVIEPIQKIWQVSRNIAYLGFTIIFVVAGFMIMFRARLSQQAVVSIQAALPGLIIGLILVTFSYFVSGLIIDLAFLGSQVIGVLFLSQLGNDTQALTHIQEILNSQNVVTMFSRFVFSGDLLGSAGVIGGQVTEIIYANTANRVVIGLLGILGACLSTIALAIPTGGTSLLVCAGLGEAIGSGISPTGGSGLGGVVISGIVYLVLLFGLLQAVFRLLFSLIGAYVTIVVTTIFSPFIILWSAVPGQGGVLALWWRALLANVLVFPAVFGLFLLVATILGNGDWHLNNEPVGKFTQTLPLFGGSSVNFVQLLLAYGLLLASPGVPDYVRELLRARPNQIMSQATARGIQGGAAPAQAFVVRGIPSLFRLIRGR